MSAFPVAIADKADIIPAAQMSANDPMYGPAVRSKKILTDWGERSCINVFGL
jgi:hypothetical protein